MERSAMVNITFKVVSEAFLLFEFFQFSLEAIRLLTQ